MSTSRLAILEASLVKKQASFDAKLQCHFDTVKLANGQPLNDKRNGHKTLAKWEGQNESLRKLDESIKRTQEAIEREKAKLANVAGFDVPECLKPLLENGTITQWRKHPRFFFVTGVEKARLAVNEEGLVCHRYIKDIPTKEQYTIFKEVYNALNAIQSKKS